MLSKPRPIRGWTIDRLVSSCLAAAVSWGSLRSWSLLPTTKEVPSAEGFMRLGVSETMGRALVRAGYHEPTPIQEQMIAPALAGRDCLGNAPTGTGKTAAFLVPILEKLDERQRRPQALVLAPTRELVVQICREFEKLCFGRRTRAVAVVGGESIFQQQRLLGMGCQLVVATPGRLMDLMARNAIRLDEVGMVVLDEADQMLDIGFRPAVETILKAVPAAAADPVALGHDAAGRPRADAGVPRRSGGRPPHCRERGCDDPRDPPVVRDGPCRAEIRAALARSWSGRTRPAPLSFAGPSGAPIASASCSAPRGNAPTPCTATSASPSATGSSRRSARDG